MKLSSELLPGVILLPALLLAACGPGNDSKPMLQQQRDAMDKARKVDETQQKEAQKQQQEADKQTQ
jgi:hypothetical protein